MIYFSLSHNTCIEAYTSTYPRRHTQPRSNRHFLNKNEKGNNLIARLVSHFLNRNYFSFKWTVIT